MTVVIRKMLSSLNKHAPKKKKLIQGNNKPYMNKILRQFITKRSILKQIKANKTKNHLDIRNYKKQRKIVVNLNKEAKLQYFSNYDSTNTKSFWKIVNHIFLTNKARPILAFY